MIFSNLADLIRIRKKTSANTDLKIEIAQIIEELRPRIEKIKSLPIAEQREAFMILKKPYTETRQFAHRNGSTSEADPVWAVPAVCESWLFGYINGTAEEIEKVEDVINQLSDPTRPEELKGFANIGNFIIFIATPLAFYFMSWWLALIVLIIGFVFKGWSSRFNGPFIVK